MKRTGKISHFVAIAAFALTIGSCTTKQSAVNDLERFSYELRDNSRDYTVDEWKGAVDKFGKIRKRISKYDYNAAERQKIGKLEGQCAKYMANGAKEGLLDKVLELGGELQGILDGLGIFK